MCVDSKMFYEEFDMMSSMAQKSKKHALLSHDEYSLRSWDKRWQQREVDRILKLKLIKQGRILVYIQHVHFLSKEDNSLT